MRIHLIYSTLCWKPCPNLLLQVSQHFFSNFPVISNQFLSKTQKQTLSLLPSMFRIFFLVGTCHGLLNMYIPQLTKCKWKWQMNTRPYNIGERHVKSCRQVSQKNKGDSVGLPSCNEHVKSTFFGALKIFQNVFCFKFFRAIFDCQWIGNDKNNPVFDTENFHPTMIGSVFL